MKERYKLTIEPLTPVHIGTGSKLNPLDYKLVKTQKGMRYARFSSDSILERIAIDVNKSREFDHISNLADMKAIQSFFHKNFTSDDIIYQSRITENFEEKYNKQLNNDPLKNACEVDELYRSVGSKFATIPGSSIKGAIRTALLDMCRDTAESFDFQKAKNNKYYENDLLQKKDAKEDPLRCISISDCIFKRNEFQTVGSLKIIKNENGILSEKNNSQIWAEVISGGLMEAVEPEEFIVFIDTDLQKSNNPKTSESQIKLKFSMKEIQDECNTFYVDNFDREYDYFYNKEKSEKYELIHILKHQIKKVTEDENAFIIRLGKWSQFEFVTLYNENKKKGKSRTLFDYNGQYLPMGWCKCTIEKL